MVPIGLYSSTQLIRCGLMTLYGVNISSDNDLGGSHYLNKWWLWPVRIKWHVGENNQILFQENAFRNAACVCPHRLCRPKFVKIPNRSRE